MTLSYMEEILTIRVPKGTRRKLERRAKAENLTLSQLVRRALEAEQWARGFREARERGMAALNNPGSLGTDGKRRWTRDALHER